MALCIGSAAWKLLTLSKGRRWREPKTRMIMLCSSKRKKCRRRAWNDGTLASVNATAQFQKAIPENSRAQLDVHLHRECEINWGIGISGGTDRGYPPFVSCIRAGSVADRSDSLQVGDRLMQVNGIKVTTLSHNEILNILKNAGEQITLTLAYDQAELNFRPSRKCISKTVDLTIQKDEPSLGFVIRGGYHDNVPLPLTVVNIRAGGLADRNGRLRIGDRVLAINGVDVRNYTLAGALDLFNKALGVITFRVEFDTLVIDSLKKSSKRPILLQIEKAPGSDLGLKLNVLEEDKCSSRRIFRIADVAPASIADRCGAFSIGDVLLSIDGVSLQLSSAAEVQQLLRGNVKSKITIEIQPSVDEKDDKSNSRARLALNRNSDGYTEIVKSKAVCFTDCSNQSESPRSPSPGSFAASINGLPYGQICRSEAMQVVLHCAFRGGYGLVFHRYNTIADCDNAPLFISYIEKGSPAEACGLLHVGDRVLSLNDSCTEAGTAENANRMVKLMSGPLTLAIEFDVIESVLPNCGVFTVKLAKRSQHLGLMIRGAVSYGKGEPVIVSDVEIGSVAYRCGTVQAGDQLLAIDNIPLDSCTVDEAIRLLQRCGELVKLRVKKFCCAYDNIGDNHAPHLIVYSLKINRGDKPLGIAVGQAADAYGHTTITQITPGSLADKTGAIHVGDRLLAINNTPLDRKPLQKVLHLLEQAGESVSLKIGRDAQARIRHDRLPAYSIDCGYNQISNEKLCTPVQSVDSAVESLDECQGNDNAASKTSNSSSLSSTNADAVIHEGNRLRHVLDSMKCMAEQQGGRYVSQVEERRSSLVDPCLEEWNKVLQALESIGEPETLQKLESTILSGGVPRIGAKPSIPPPPMPAVNFGHQWSPGETKTIVKKHVLLSKIEEKIEASSSSNANPNETMHYELIPHFGSRRHAAKSIIRPLKLLSLPGSTEPAKESCCNAKTAIELHNVVLKKDPVHNDFGFSISDGLDEKGIFVHQLRTGGPADQSGKIKPVDRILEVNHVSLQDVDCLLAAPLLASCGDQVELLISRLVEPPSDENSENRQPI